MECYINEKDLVLEGFKNVNVVHRESGLYEIWCEDWEICYGYLPPNFPENALQVGVNVAMEFYRKGEKTGEEYGKRLKALEITRALGLSN